MELPSPEARKRFEENIVEPSKKARCAHEEAF